MSITIDDEPPSGFDESWESVELATGTAYVEDEVSFIRFVQRRGDLWLWSFDVADDQAKLAAAYDELVLAPDGTVAMAWDRWLYWIGDDGVVRMLVGDSPTDDIDLVALAATVRPATLEEAALFVE